MLKTFIFYEHPKTLVGSSDSAQLEYTAWQQIAWGKYDLALMRSVSPKPPPPLYAASRDKKKNCRMTDWASPSEVFVCASSHGGPDPGQVLVCSP